MRVVSQDGKIDIPYENSCLNIVCIEPKRTAIYSYSTCCDASLRLAEYTTEEKAIKAMEMLREVYLLKAEIHSDYNGHHYKAELNKVFQFPQDDEIEV